MCFSFAESVRPSLEKNYSEHWWEPFFMMVIILNLVKRMHELILFFCRIQKKIIWTTFGTKQMLEPTDFQCMDKQDISLNMFHRRKKVFHFHIGEKHHRIALHVHLKKQQISSRLLHFQIVDVSRMGSEMPRMTFPMEQREILVCTLSWRS